LKTRILVFRRPSLIDLLPFCLHPLPKRAHLQQVIVDVQDGNVSSWIRGRFGKSLGWRMSCMTITVSL
ncbi:hypothetical protein, partial [Neisseria oralis]|uniref:hypothetical protein n=1 Tax=Neisseria oralis TaxID=1107316 RepID=UPI0027DFD31F